MNGDQGADTLFGGEDADVLRSGAGDEVYGGPGNDPLRALPEGPRF
ncbi:MAG: hypothetical protein ACRDQ2_11960 [Gaiellales bacterium]